MFNKKFLRKFIVASVAVGALTFVPESYCLPIGTAVVHAEIKEYVGVGESIVSDRETPELGKQGAKLQAIRNAQKQAGVFIGSLSVMKNHELDTDEVVAFTAGIVKVGNVSYEPVPVEQWIKYRATVTVTLDTDDLNGQINRWLGINAQDRSTITEQTKALNGKLDMIQTRTVELETAVAGATATVDNEKIKAELKQINRDILYAQKISEGNELMRKGNRAGAMKLYQEAIALYPKDATIAYEKLGDSHLVRKGDNASIDAYTKAIQTDPNYAVPYHKRGDVYFRMGDYQKAAADFKKTVELAPNSTDAFKACIKAYILSGDCDKAIEFYKYNSYGHRETPQYLITVRDCTAAINAGKATADTYFERAKFYAAWDDVYRSPDGHVYHIGKDKMNALALDDFNKAVELNPNNGNYFYERAKFHMWNKNYNGAVKDFERSFQLQPKLNAGEQISRYKFLGDCYEKSGYKSKAIEIYKLALKEKDFDKFDKKIFQERIERLKKVK